MAYEIKACQLSQSIYVEQEGMVAVLPFKNKQKKLCDIRTLGMKHRYYISFWKIFEGKEISELYIQIYMVPWKYHKLEVKIIF